MELGAFSVSLKTLKTSIRLWIFEIFKNNSNLKD